MMPEIVFSIITGMAEFRRIKEQLKCLLVESYYTRGCVCLFVCLALDYSQFTAFMFGSTINMFVLIKYKLTKCTFSKLISYFLIFDVLYMFRTRRFTFRKTVLYTCMV